MKLVSIYIVLSAAVFLAVVGCGQNHNAASDPPSQRLAEDTNSFKHAPTGLQLHVPQGWQATGEADSPFGMFLIPDSGDAIILLIADETTDFDPSWLTADVSTLLAESLEDVHVQNAVINKQLETATVHDVKRAWFSGEAVLNGTPARWEISLVSGKQQNLLLIATGELQNHRMDLENIYKSFALSKD